MLIEALTPVKKDTTKKEEPFSGLEGEQLKAAQRIAKEF
jgi:hypothetical protein